MAAEKKGGGVVYGMTRTRMVKGAGGREQEEIINSAPSALAAASC